MLPQSLVLSVVKMNELPDNLFLQRALDPPPKEQVHEAMRSLKRLRLVQFGHITGLGRQVESLPVAPNHGVSLLAGRLFGLHSYMARVIAYLSTQATLFPHPRRSTWVIDSLSCKRFGGKS